MTDETNLSLKEIGLINLDEANKLKCHSAHHEEQIVKLDELLRWLRTLTSELISIWYSRTFEYKPYNI